MDVCVYTIGIYIYRRTLSTAPKGSRRQTISGTIISSAAVKRPVGVLAGTANPRTLPPSRQLPNQKPPTAETSPTARTTPGRPPPSLLQAFPPRTRAVRPSPPVRPARRAVAVAVARSLARTSRLSVVPLSQVLRPGWDPCPACKGSGAKNGLDFDDFCMANVKLGCIPYKNRPDRSPVEGAGRGLSHFRRPSAAAAANCRTQNRQLPNPRRESWRIP